MWRAGMSNENIAGEAVAADGSVTFAFGQRLSALQFDAVFKDGMSLVERTASYLDGPGRQDARRLSSNVTVLYATESMRLTARLLDVASWLLIRRALREGEINENDADAKRRRLKLQPLGRPSHTKGFDELPDSLRQLVAESFTMLERIAYLEQRDSSGDDDIAGRQKIVEVRLDNPVGAQVIRLRDALTARGR